MSGHEPEEQPQKKRQRQAARHRQEPDAVTRRRLAVIYLTDTGGYLARRLQQAWPQTRVSGDRLVILDPVQPLAAMLRDVWGSYDGFILIMAVGISVRLIAPLLQSKWCDPGVVVVDEGGNFAVSLVGGHWGGANRLAREVAACVGAAPVVTTATDIQGKPAIDLLAKQWGFHPVPRERVKVINSALLAGELVEIFSEWDLSGDAGLETIPCRLLQELEQNDPDRGEPAAVPVLITSRSLALPPRGIFLRPLSLAAGIGCRRGVAAAEIEGALEEALLLAGRSRDSLALLATHEIKADEAGLLETAAHMGLALQYFSSSSLGEVYQACPGLQRSEFVQQRLGVGGVCETAALAAVPEGELVLPKTIFNRVTVALAEAGWLWSASGREIRRT